MTIARYFEGIVLLGIAFVPIGAAAGAWRERLLPGWRGPIARLSELILGVTAVVVLSEVMGAIHLFTLWAIVPTMAASGAVGWWWARHVSLTAGTSDRAEKSRVLPPAPPGTTVAAIVAVAMLVADWATRTVDALHHGMNTADTLWYHMPFAARFVQQGTIVPLHYVDSESVTVFFPASSELIHALGILFMGSDILSPFINSAWMALALLAAWCIGRPFGVAPVTMSGAAVLLATPGLVATQPGGAYDDVVGLALLTTCAALLITASTAVEGTRFNGQAVAALAAGVALGTKFTFIPPVVALTVGIAVLARRGRRLPETGLWILLLAVTGSFWYLRNLITVGNPLPSLKLGIGTLSLPSPAVTTPTSTFAHFVLNGSDWHRYFFPGLRLSFGPVWWALLGLAGAGLIFGAVKGPGRMPKMLGWVGLATAAAFFVTPQYLTILGEPVYFVDNIRYVDPAVGFGLTLLPLMPMLRIGRRSWWVLGTYVAVIGVTQLDGTIWPTSWLPQRFAPPIGGADSLSGLLIGVVALGVGLSLWMTHRQGVRLPLKAVLGVIVVVLALGFNVQQFYLQHRYTNGDGISIFAWAQRVNGARIGVAGDYTQLQYLVYGRDLSNYVQYVAQTSPHHGYSPPTSCSSWRRAVNQGHFDYLITSTNPSDNRSEVFSSRSSYSSWTSSDPAAILMQSAVAKMTVAYGRGAAYVGFSLFRLKGELDPAGCSDHQLKGSARAA